MKVILMALGFGLAMEQAAAQALIDPTRPPDVAEAAGDTLNASRGPLLQAVLISTGRRYAVIDGHQVGLGAKIGAARIVGITESAVILEGASGRTTLKLLPGVGRTTVEPASESPEIERKAVRK